MKADLRSSVRRLPYLTVAIATALVIGPSMAFSAGVGEKIADGAWDFHDRVQAVANKSVPGYIEASREGPAPETRDRPFSLDDLNKTRQKNADLLQQTKARAQAQQQLINMDAEFLSKLPPDDPRRAQLSAELKQVASQMPDTQKQLQTLNNRVSEADAAVDRFRQNHDPAYIPPTKPKTVRSKPPEPVEQPNTDDNSGGGGGDDTDNGAGSLRKREAEKEAEARALGKQREAAVNKYLDDPSANNRAEAEAIKARLNGMVDDLNQLRGQVDGIDGVSRPPIHVKSAKAIAKARRQRLQNPNPNPNPNPNGSETNQGTGGGGGCGMSTGGEHHNPDGSDATGGYKDVGPGGGENANAQSGSGSGAGGGRHHGRRSASHTAGGGRNGGGGQSGVTSSGQYQRSAAGTRGKKQTNGASNQNHQNHQKRQGHHQNGGGGRGSNQQAMQQQRQKQYHPQQQQNFQQQQQQQQRRKRRGG